MKRVSLILSAAFLFTMMLTSCGGDASNEESSSNKVANADQQTGDIFFKKFEYQEALQEFQLPKEIKYDGKFIGGKRYKDKSGEYITIITETGSYENNKNEGEDAELFAYNFVISGGSSIKQIWRIYDFFKDCHLDITANFIDNTFRITDLNNDGIAEVWHAYFIGCKGDVSPWDMKIIMYEGKQKFAMRGTQKIIMQDYIDGGDYKFDDAFNNGPKIFRDFAEDLWNENGILNFD